MRYASEGKPQFIDLKKFEKKVKHVLKLFILRINDMTHLQRSSFVCLIYILYNIASPSNAFTS